jgi:hypothetical protein
VPRLATATGGEREILERQMNLFRKMVTNPLDEAIKKIAQKRHDKGKTKESAEVREIAKSIGISG